MPYGFTCLNRNCITHNDKEFIQELKQQLQACKEELQAYKEDRFCQGGCTVYQFDKIKQLKEENEKLKGRNEHLEKVHEVDTHFCTAFINLKEGLSKILHHYYFTRGKYNLESMCLIPAIQTLVGRLRGKVDKQEKEIELLTQQNKQMREFIEKLYTIADDGQNMIKKHNDYNGKIYGLGYLQDIKDRIYNTQQALNKGVE
jgi:predicted ribosome quality control (RQC) complex YloA/Tae2 family protein